MAANTTFFLVSTKAWTWARALWTVSAASLRLCTAVKASRESAFWPDKAKERAAFYHSAVPLPELKGKTIILVDDGVATGATLFVQIRSLRKKGIARLIIAVPVASSDAWQKIRKLADEAICPSVHGSLLGISNFYTDFSPFDDETVMSLLKEGSV